VFLVMGSGHWSQLRSMYKQVKNKSATSIVVVSSKFPNTVPIQQEKKVVKICLGIQSSLI
jgi:hypothetical protein